MNALTSLPYLLWHAPALGLLIHGMLPGGRHALRHGRRVEYFALVLTALHTIPLMFVLPRLPALSVIFSGLAWLAIFYWSMYARRGELTPPRKPTRPE